MFSRLLTLVILVFFFRFFFLRRTLSGFDMAATRWALEDGSVGGLGGNKSTSGTGEEFVERVGGGSEHILIRSAVEGGVVVVVVVEEEVTATVVLISSSTDGSLD